MKSCPQDGLIRTLVDGLVARRLELGLSQRDIAQRLFLTHSCVSLFENHRREHHPGDKTMSDIVDRIGALVDDGIAAGTGTDYHSRNASHAAPARSPHHSSNPRDERLGTLDYPA